MRVHCLLFLILAISGCGSNDPRPKSYQANVVTVGNKVCILAPVESDEYLNGIEFNSSSGEQKRLRKHFSNDDVESIRVLAGKCIPNFGYDFKSGYDYGVLVETYSKERLKQGEHPVGRNYIASFSLSSNQGKLVITPN